MAHILIVDDDDISAEITAHILMDAGHASGWVCDTSAAIKVVEKRRPDLVLLDQNLPGENGTVLLRRLRNSPKYYDLPVIMLTGAVGMREEQIARYSGAEDYIRKPFGTKMLLFRINQVLKTSGSFAVRRTIGQRMGTEQDAGPVTPPLRMV